MQLFETTTVKGNEKIDEHQYIEGKLDKLWATTDYTASYTNHSRALRIFVGEL